MTLQQLKYVITIADCGSMNEAAKRLYLSQPSLSETVMSLEEEIGVELFIRTNRGIRTTVEGEEFLSYARQVVEQYQLLDDKYISHTNSRKKFCVSMQHYTFAVKAFVVVAKEFGFDEYEFAVRETKTAAVIEDVKNFKSEIGILYRNDFNAKVLDKLLDKNELDFHELFTCNTCVYLWNGHPLAENKKITMKELEQSHVLLRELHRDKARLNDDVFGHLALTHRLAAQNGRCTLLLHDFRTEAVLVQHIVHTA